MLLRVLGGLSDMTRGEIGDSNTGGGDELCKERDDRRGNPRFNICSGDGIKLLCNTGEVGNARSDRSGSSEYSGVCVFASDCFVSHTESITLGPAMGGNRLAFSLVPLWSVGSDRGDAIRALHEALN